MVVYFSVIIASESVHVGVNEDYNEGVEQVEQEPGVHHLHVRGLWKAVTYVDKHRRQHKHGCQVDSNNSLYKITRNQVENYIHIY